MTRTKQQELEQAQNLHLIRDERDLELENRARSRAHAGLQLGCLLLAALCYLQGDPAWTVLLALPLLGCSIQCFCRYAGDREPLFLAVGFLSGLLALFLGGPFLVRLLGESPLSPGPPGLLCPSGRSAHRPGRTAVRPDGAVRLLAES